MSERKWLQIESYRFTTLSAFTREILALLEHSDYGLELVIKASERERLDVELEGVRTLGRVSVTII